MRQKKEKGLLTAQELEIVKLRSRGLGSRKLSLWTKEEKDRFEHGIDEHGNNWKEVHACVGESKSLLQVLNLKNYISQRPENHDIFLVNKIKKS